MTDPLTVQTHKHKHTQKSSSSSSNSNSQCQPQSILSSPLQKIQYIQ